ncbi:MAG: AraC family transcriptional regulator [Flavobacteriales bacterium]|nr:AraC family transcriptional regulator [Flavobacteriales bacterium]
MLLVDFARRTLLKNTDARSPSNHLAHHATGLHDARSSQRFMCHADVPACHEQVLNIARIKRAVGDRIAISPMVTILGVMAWVLALICVGITIIVLRQRGKWKKKASILIQQNRKQPSLENKTKPLVGANEQIIPDDNLSELKEKYAQSKLSKTDKEILIQSLLLLIEEEHVYRQVDLTIKIVAEKLDSNTSYLSQIINEEFDTNFNGFINQFRVKEATRMMSEKKYRNLTINGVAKETGFKSISSFYQAFKKMYGITPAFFLKSVIKAEKEQEHTGISEVRSKVQLEK